MTNTFRPDAFSSAARLAREHRLRDRVALVEHDDLGLLREAVSVGRELGPDRPIGAHDRGLGAVDQMQDHARALRMAEELHAEARAFMRAFDQAGKIGDHEVDCP